ncbi:MAG TPA: undecaprenyl/decaprenyl-phosphate alpha-N-acetylglucosaminyl 1-phosphate transferase [Tenericutes bacterium]|nr:undecaprenyl/decaprenyl-phosphate alpha-N-acetylglucosaminyl 1-phosphate transferase [Mycoplasmatota bacterium]
MGNLDITNKIFLMVLITFLTSTLLMPFIKRIAIQVNALDIPRGRHIHKTPTPKLGGLGIFLSFLLGYMIFGEPSSQMNSILIGSFIIIITGIIDDIVELKAFTKFIGQLIASLVITVYGQILLSNIDAFGIYLEFGIFTYPLTIFFILGCINCINLIDGLDGLSGGISSIYFLTIGIISTIQGKFGLDFILTFTMFGSTLGFLVHNFHPASIFAGDTGSMFMGFIISVIALLGFKNITLTSLVIPLLVLAIPILDTIFAIVRRTLKGESIAKADKFHIHHQLLNRSFSQTKTVLIIYFINILFAIASIVYVLKDKVLGYVVYSILLLIVIIFVLKTNVVIDHDIAISKIKNKITKIKNKKNK